MNDTVIKNFCMWARRELITGVETRMRLYAIADDAEPAGSETVAGRVLSPQESEQRDELLRLGHAEGFEHLRGRAAYTWFNRIAAVRYMEVHDYFPSCMRMFTRPAADGGWELGSQAVDEALDIEIEGIDPAHVMELKQTGEDEPLFRYLFLAQCDELADCLPGVFKPVDACMALLLPPNLMEPEGVIGHMVADIDEDDWSSVQILGWMYQYYNAEVKDAFFKSKAKETPDTIGPATQLFTPDWIVRYMVENSLGRLWMLNNPQSELREQMEYYIEPDAEHEDFIHVEGPEDITLCDPACGSGHILVYAFDLLFQMYLERGYREREIPELILTKNLSGMEIDPRAAQIASLALAMCAREHDRRFFRRGVSADITVLESTVLEEDDIPQGCDLAKKKDLVGALAYLDEVGSLLNPSEEGLAALAEAIKLCGETDGLFGNNAKEKLERAMRTCKTLARTYHCVVANPPYMGSSSFGPFMSKWVKKNYPDVKSDLFSSFVVRMFDFAKAHGECGVMSPFVWMFIGSYEKLRTKIINEKTLTSLIQLEYSGFAGATVPICTYTFHNSYIEGYKGGYVRLSDFVGASVQAPKAFEAIKNPDCGWFYRRNAKTFTQIPGTPIAYWVSEELVGAYDSGTLLGDIALFKEGITTGDNERFLRLWYELSHSRVGPRTARGAVQGRYWSFCNKGGQYRKWYGNLLYVIDWSNGGEDLAAFPGCSFRNAQYQGCQGGTYSNISSGSFSIRFSDEGIVSESKGAMLYAKQLMPVLAFMNCSVAGLALQFLCPTLDFKSGQLKSLPFLDVASYQESLKGIVSTCIDLSKRDWDSFETSWNFKRHPLV